MVGTILINGKFLASRITGVQRYALELFRHMDTILDEPSFQNLRLVCLVPHEVQVDPGWRQIELRRVGFNSGNLWEQFDLPIHARGMLLFSPANTGPIFYSNQVITFHDAAVFAVPEAYSTLFRLKYWVIFNILGRSARLVLTDSAFSQGELSHYLGIPRERFRVILLGGDHLREISADVGILQKHALKPKSYLLSVASQSYHKNFVRVLKAAELVGPIVEFAAAGGSFNQIFQKTELDSRQSNVRVLGYINDRELKALYENALGFIFPSLYEGFGLPILEAMNTGCPVLCSNAASIPEVGGQAVLYFDPQNIEDMASVIRKFLADPALRADLQTRARERAAIFPWELTARKTLTELAAYL